MQRRHEHATKIKTEPAVTVELSLAPPRRNKKEAPEPPPTRVPTASQGRVPRVARLMALAIRFQDMIDRGEVRDYAELARLGYVSRARVTQIMNLLNLRPTSRRKFCSYPRRSAEVRLRSAISDGSTR